MTNQKKYVYDFIEVVQTGRTAVKTLTSTSRRTKEVCTNEEVVVEITPANAGDGTWKKWVKEGDLYEIKP